LRKLARRISQLTLAQADQAGVFSGQQVWRGSHRLFKALQKKKTEAHEFATWQDDCRKTHAAHDRFRANWWRQWRDGLTHKRRASGMSTQSPDVPEDAQNAVIGAVARSTWAGQMLELVKESDKSEPNDMPQGSNDLGRPDSGRRLMGRQKSIKIPDSSGAEDVSNDEPETDLIDSAPGSKEETRRTVGKRGSVLSGMKNRLAGNISGSKGARSSAATTERIMALMEARKAEFECLPVQERDMLRQAFLRCDSDGSNTLDPREIRKSLAELGIQGKTPDEKRVVTQICRDAVALQGVNFFDFVFQIVPIAKQELTKVRRGALRERFEDCDLDDSGLLSQEECKEVVIEWSEKGMDSTTKRMFHKDFPRLFAQCQLSGSDEIDFEGFVILLQLLEEHQAQIVGDREKYIATSNQLPPHMVLQYRGELISLYEAFQKADEDGSCYLERKEVMNLMLEMGLSANEGEGREIVEATLDKLDLYAGIGFLDFLFLVKGVRQEEELMAMDQVKQLFHKYDADHSGHISFAEASEVMSDMGLGVSSIKDKSAIRELFEDVDQNGGGDLDVDEFYILMQKVLDRLYMHAPHQRN
jgi:Ca2+-binding EF-hand superfamily protein